ncbi:hypothetical protein [Ancylothrix sp. D3o]
MGSKEIEEFKTHLVVNQNVAKCGCINANKHFIRFYFSLKRY